MVTHVGGKPFSCGICNKAYQVTWPLGACPHPCLLPIAVCCLHVVRACLQDVTNNLILRKPGSVLHEHTLSIHEALGYTLSRLVTFFFGLPAYK